ncbi:autotransporter outer membrane beta-barrel domain-containing protein [Roseibium sp. RKSG952]|uniref:autotransporter outer membrane beta-barrel domain-containing protein n=1 Tax=Roseibium sp. RKSG952 TaxID=2529384 RepID=UPI0012BD7365|nr:autotransporter outer membrane beta-barrel domain-containing protein [Roseibium sp. RKSG952]MTH95302.1 autotransporter outer membrane beta-barrel domain-containing protein [Roseibium sp. RKSG952]
MIERYPKMLAFLSIAAAFFYSGSSLRASCIVSDSVAKCFGVIEKPISYTDGLVSEIIIADQKNTLTGSVTVELSDISILSNVNSNALTIKYHATDFGIDASEAAITVNSSVGDNILLNTNNDNKDGGTAGGILTTFERTIINSSGAGIIIKNKGGLGASGSAGSVDGGDGGDAEVIRLNYSDETNLNIFGGIGIQIIQEGGGAGDGLNAGSGGNGGSGGDGVGISIRNTKTGGTKGTLSISSQQNSDYPVNVVSLGGDGGIGGDGGLSIGDTNGNGGQGGEAGDIYLELNSLSIKTIAEKTPGIQTVSQGGKGGVSGGAFVYSINGSNRGTPGREEHMAAAESGSYGNVTIGGHGNSGGDISTHVQGEIIVNGENSQAIYSVTRGGDGGLAGGSLVGTVPPTSGTGYTVGGNGGNGGNSGAIAVKNFASLSVSGTESDGLYAYSKAGDGALGGGSVTLIFDDLNIAGNNFVTLDSSFEVGGYGGVGGSAESIEVENYAKTSTSGYNATGISAKSSGGIGGNGGGSATIEFNASVSNDAAVSALTGPIEIGGNGGDGEQAGHIYVKNSDIVIANGSSATGVDLQSTGGNGALGGGAMTVDIDMSGSADRKFSTLVDNTIVGGKGSQGGHAATIRFTNFSEISVSGDEASGLKAVSAGGRGDLGGGAASIDIDLTGFANGQISILTDEVLIGGDGGSGGSGSEVYLVNSGVLSASGVDAFAINAISEGGRGSLGGGALSLEVKMTDTPNKSSRILSGNTFVGGSGGSGAGASEVTVFNHGTILVEGTGAIAGFVESTGGSGAAGGGSASLFVDVDQLRNFENGSSNIIGNGKFGGDGGNGGDGATVLFSNLGSIRAKGDSVYGILARSTGAAGASGSGDLTFSDASTQPFQFVIGGAGGQGGAGGEVFIYNTGDISVEGQQARGLFADSIGMSGGPGSASLNVVTTSSNEPKFSVIGAGGVGGDSASVSITSSGTITSIGDQAVAIYSATVGGVGGEAAGSASIEEYYDNANISVQAGNGGDAGNVSIEITGDISVSGENASAVYVKSVGGDGGIASSTINSTGINTSYYAVGTFSGDGGNGGDILVSLSSAVSVAGEGAVGIQVNSDGGIGGICGLGENDNNCINGLNGKGGNSNIRIADFLSVSGQDSHAIMSNFGGSVAHGSTEVIVEKGGAILHSNDGGNTIHLGGDDENFVYINGIVKKNEFNKLNNYVIYGENAKNSIIIGTEGLLSGSILFDGSSGNQIKNLGILELGLVVDLGVNTNTRILNAGTMSVGPAGAINTSKIVTNLLEQPHSEQGNWALDIEFGTSPDDTRSDFISLVGSANINGVLDARVVGDNLVTTGDSGTITIMSASNTIEAAMDINDAAAIEYILEVVDGTELDLSYAINLERGVEDGIANDYARGLDRQIHYVRENFMPGSPEWVAQSEFTTFMLNLDSSQNLEKVYRQNAPDEAGLAIQTSRSAAFNFHDLLHSCQNISSTSIATYIGEKNCHWFSYAAYNSHQASTSDNPGFDESRLSVFGGNQRTVGDRMFVGIAGGVDMYKTNGENYNQDGYRIQIGSSLKRELNMGTISGTLASGIFGYNYNRTYMNSGGFQTARSNPSGGFVGGELRLSSFFKGHSLYAKPSLAGSAIQVWQNAFTETDADDFGWDVDDISEQYFAFRPAMEIGRIFKLKDNPTLFFLQAGMTAIVNNPNVRISGKYTSFGEASPEFYYDMGTDRYYGQLKAGLDIDVKNAGQLSISSSAIVSENTSSAGGNIRFTYKF